MGGKYKAKPAKAGSAEALNGPSPQHALHQVHGYPKEPKHAYSHQVKKEGAKSSLFGKFSGAVGQQPMTPAGTTQQYMGQGMRTVPGTLSPVCESGIATQLQYSSSVSSLQMQKAHSQVVKQPTHMNLQTQLRSYKSGNLILSQTQSSS